MRSMALLNAQYRVLLVVSLISSCVLGGCGNPFERFYKPTTSTGTLVTPPTSPLFAWSQDLDGDGKQLAQNGYVLIGTSWFQSPPFDGLECQYLTDRPWWWSECGLSEAEAAVAQGKRVGAEYVLLKVKFSAWEPCGVPGPIMCPTLMPPPIWSASYWAKTDPADR